ncbi:MAG TPA: hypothetical protein VG944_21625 [Fimbriimonas sp.]|nr:hypothetical protein [Fimbriimonas sp.]
MQPRQPDSPWLKAAVCVGALIVLGAGYEIYERETSPPALKQDPLPKNVLLRKRPITITFTGQDNYPEGKIDTRPGSNRSGPRIMSVLHFRSDEPLPNPPAFYTFVDCGDGVPQESFVPTGPETRSFDINIEQGYGRLLYSPIVHLLGLPSEGVSVRFPRPAISPPKPRQLIPDGFAKADPRLSARLTGPDSFAVTLSAPYKDQKNLVLRVHKLSFIPFGEWEGPLFPMQFPLPVYCHYAIDQKSAEVELDKISTEELELEGQATGATLLTNGQATQLVIDHPTHFKKGDWDVVIPPQRRTITTDLGHASGSLRLDVRYKGLEMPWFDNHTGVGKESAVATMNVGPDRMPYAFKLFAATFTTIGGKDRIKLATLNTDAYRDHPPLPRVTQTRDFGPIMVKLKGETVTALKLFQTTIPIEHI